MPKNSGPLGKLLRDALDEQGYTIRNFAELTKIDKATISRIINGKRKPTLQHLKKFSAVLNVPFNDLVEAVDQEERKDLKEPKEKRKAVEIHALGEWEILQKSVQLHDQSITLEKISGELEKSQAVSETFEGSNMIRNGFKPKVEHFGNSGPYISRLKIWHHNLLFSQGTKKELAIMGGALLYFILPLDLLHDYVFAVGYLDDCLAIQLAANKLEDKV